MSDSMFMILSMGFVVLSVRSVAFIFANYISLPATVKDTLELLPTAILSVIVAGGILFNETGSIDISLANKEFVATLITLIIAVKIKGFFSVIAIGYGIYFILTQFI